MALLSPLQCTNERQEPLALWSFQVRYCFEVRNHQCGCTVRNALHKPTSGTVPSTASSPAGRAGIDPLRGIHARPNTVWHQIVALVTPSAARLTETFCINCGGDIEGGSNCWPCVCRHCGRDLTTDRHSQTSADVSQQSGELAKREVQPLDP